MFFNFSHRGSLLLQTSIPVGSLPTEPLFWLPLGLQPLPPSGLFSEQLSQIAPRLPLLLTFLSQPAPIEPVSAVTPLLFALTPRRHDRGRTWSNGRNERLCGRSASQTLHPTVPRELATGADWAGERGYGCGWPGKRGDQHWCNR